MDFVLMALIAGGVGIIFALYLIYTLLKRDRGPEMVREISKAIEEGALAFLYREYKTLAWFVVVVAIILGVFLEPRGLVAIAYLAGTFCSAAAGYIGMRVGLKANCRTVAGVMRSLNDGLRVAFNSGTVMGICVVSLGLVGLSIIYLAFQGQGARIADILVGFGAGASSIALFARVGGGIFTKAADVGSDLVGKVEAGIPEDDPRNPAVIADNVGDNVGDIAGMGGDLFESYVGAIIATMTVAIAAGFAVDSHMVLLPFVIAATGIISSIIGTFFVRVGKQLNMEALLMALRRGIWVSSILVAIASYLAVRFMNLDIGIFYSILAGLAAGVLIGLSIEYYTSYSYKPTRSVSEASQTGTGTLIIRGFSTGMLSTVAPVLFVVIAVLAAYEFAGLYGVAITAVGMLSTLGITLATDAYGPVADNAGGIAEQAHLPAEVREKTDALDSMGNTTAATGKGFAIGSAALTALGLTAAFGGRMAAEGHPLTMSLLDPKVVCGILIGSLLVFLFSALTMNAVGRAAMQVVDEVRRQWHEIEGIMTGEAKPDYARCVDITTRTALKEMILPGLLAIVIPVAVGMIPFLGPDALGGLLIGAIGSGFLLAVTMANAGGTWDNAKKYIELGHFGGKGSEQHKAAVVGDTVGDPFKDTSGPSLNILIKLMAMVSLLCAPMF
ncbi:MAG: putative K(+)-stimulated pyrophosphate-energized sodium pump [Firmicutes bacterium]|nr:putative K(+)-stimulated pyrophosphate-energized sodium pump [Bacillota bacterium]